MRQTQVIQAPKV